MDTNTNRPEPVRIRDRSPVLLRVEETARDLSLSTRSVWRLIQLGELETVRCGCAVRVTRESVEAFVRRGGTTL